VVGDRFICYYSHNSQSHWNNLKPRHCLLILTTFTNHSKITLLWKTKVRQPYLYHFQKFNLNVHKVIDCSARNPKCRLEVYQLQLHKTPQFKHHVVSFFKKKNTPCGHSNVHITLCWTMGNVCSVLSNINDNKWYRV
jgi:hypothetical protein